MYGAASKKGMVDFSTPKKYRQTKIVIQGLPYSSKKYLPWELFHID
jgi:hypothetical protein